MRNVIEYLLFPGVAGVLTLLLVGLPAYAQAPAGTIEFSIGQVAVRGANGLSRDGARGVAVAAGDTVETGAGRAQMRMIDGAYISLQPQTSLRVQAYALASPGTEERGFLNLLRGGLRTVTGLVGRTKRENYRLTTTTATLGIRGTEFAVTTDDGTRVNVTAGVVALCTTGGCVDVEPGQSGFAPDRQTRPSLAFARARLPPIATSVRASFLIGEVRDSAGASLEAVTAPVLSSAPATLPIVPLGNGPGSFSAASVSTLVSTLGSFTAGLLSGTLTSAPSGLITQSIDCCTVSNNYTAGTSGDFGADGIIAWGRWSTGVHGVGTPLLTMNYVASLTANAVDSTATPNIVRGYATFASTAPIVTLAGTVVATGVVNSVTGSLNVNFPNWASGGGTLTYALNVPVAGQTFSISGHAVQLGSGAGFLGSSSTITSNGAGCAFQCSGNIPSGDAIQGIFAGHTANRAGANYGFNSSIGQVGGAVVFK